MKKYIIPKATVVEFSAEVLLADSLPMGTTPVDGNSALSNRRFFFDDDNEEISDASLFDWN